MSHYSRNGMERRSRERDNHYRRKERDRERSWNREKERPRSFFRGRRRDSDYSDRSEHRRYRPPSRDEKIVLIRRDRERDEDRKERTPKESFKRKEIKQANNISILRSPPIPHKNKDQRQTHKDNHLENGKIPDSVTQSAGSVTLSHTNHVTSKSNVSLKEEIFHPVISHVEVDRKETSSQPSVPINQVIINTTKLDPVVDRKEIGHKFTVPVNYGKCNQISSHSRVEKVDKKINPVQQELVNRCFSNCKIRGDFDKIRRECMLDIDTKPAFINARAKVMDITERFLQKAHYHPQMDKAKLRENLKKSFELSKGFQAGLESLVNQILLPKIPSLVQPIIEAEVQRCLSTSTLSNNRSNSGCEKQLPQPVNKCVEKDYSKMFGEITQATSSSYSYLSPLNVIMDSEPVSTSSSKKARNHLLESFIDKQLHDDIQEELNEEKNGGIRPHFEVRFSPDTPKETKDKSADDHGQDIEMQEIHLDIDSATDNMCFVVENQPNELSDINVESEVIESVNACATINIETGATQDKDFERSVVNEFEIQGESNGSVVEKSHQSISHTSDEIVKDTDDDMEEDSDEESPEFEKIGEVSPVRIDSLLDFEIPICDTLVSQPIEQPCPTVVEPECTNNNNVTIDEVKKSECDNRVVESGLTVCKFLVPNDLTNFRHKMLFYNHIDKLE